MDKRQKEVILGQLKSEEAVLDELRRQYDLALEDINRRIKILMADATPSRVYQAQFQERLKAQVEAAYKKLMTGEYKTIQSYLDDCYTNGYVGTMYGMHGQGVPVILPIDRKAAHKAIITDSKLSYDLYASVGYDMDVLKAQIRREITRGIASSLPYEQIARNISDRAHVALSNANRIARTEGHRIQQASADDARHKAKEKGADVVKQWDASLDGATRPLHRRLDGQIREIDEPFEAGGKKVMYPGKFNDPAQDCNCRCVALTRARSALDEKELETLKERAAFFELDKTDDFEDFKKKYLKAVENKEKYGIIKTDKQFGKKIGKHASDYGLDPSRKADRQKMLAIIDDICDTAEEVVPGEWRGQDGPVKFYIKGDDAVVTTKDDVFITILKGGITNARVKNARRKEV